MGCTVIVRKDCVLTAYLGEDDGVATYDGTPDDLAAVIRRLLSRRLDLQAGVRRRATTARRLFGCSAVSSHYLRFLTVLAAKPRPRRRKVFTDGLDQKRVVLSRGWLCPSLKGLDMQREMNMQRWNDRLVADPTPQAMIDLTRAAVLQYAYVVAQTAPPESFRKLLAQTLELYRGGVKKFPRSLVLRFNYIRAALHLAGERDRDDAARLAERTLAESPSRWKVDPLDDVFPYDFFSTTFNYRAYLDAVTRHATGGRRERDAMVRLILASLHHHLGLHTGNLEALGRAVELDPDFPPYRLEVARGLARTEDRANHVRAGEMLADLALTTPLFVEACDVLEHLRDERDYVHPTLEAVVARVNRAQRNGHVMDDVGDGRV
jgi:hypothetical protein